MCFAINIPSAEATDYYIAMTAPVNVGYYKQTCIIANTRWAAIGIGNKMPRSLMFIIAQDGNGNVTLSVRLST
jgi:Cytochrome domain of cellobiose dehydrogenase